MAKIIKPLINKTMDGEVQKVQWVRELTKFCQLHIETVFSPYRGEDNLIDGVVASTRDISENKQAEEVLQQYKHIVDTNADMMALIDSNYIYKAVNKKYPDAFEKPLEQAVGCHVKDVMGEKMFLESAKENLDKALSGETVNFQIWRDLPCPAYKTVYVVINCITYSLPDGKIVGILMSVHDIAELKLAKDELEKRQAQRIGNLGFFDLDLSSENAFWSEEYYNIYGVDPDDFTLNAQAVRKLIYPEG